MRKIIILFYAVSVSMALSAADSAIRVGSDGSVEAGGLDLRIVHASKGWKAAATQNSETVSFPGEAGTVVPGKGNVRTGVFQVDGGSFRFTQSVDLSLKNRAKIRFELESEQPVESEALYLAATLPLAEFLGRRVTANGRELRFGESYNPERWRA